MPFKACAPQPEKPLWKEARESQLKSSPCSLQLEKALGQKQRFSAVKNKINSLKLKKDKTKNFC